MKTKNLLIISGGTEPADSIVVRNDNLATISTFEGLRSISNKHASTITDNFALTIDFTRSTRLSCSQLAGLIPRSDFGVVSDLQCISYGGGYLAGGSSDGIIRLWRVLDGDLVIEQHLNIGPISCILIDPNLWIVVVGSETGRIGAWAIPDLYTSAAHLAVWDVHSLRINDIALSSSGRVYSVSDDKTVKCYDLAAQCEILSVSFQSSLICCALSHNESVLYCGAIDGTISQIELSQNLPRISYSGHKEQITSILVSPDDRSLYTASIDKTVCRWDTATGQNVNHVELKSIPVALHWVPNLDTKPELNEVEEQSKKKGKKDKILSRQNALKKFPALSRNIKGNTEIEVSAEVEEAPPISPEEELEIAVSDLCSPQPVTPFQ